MRDGPVERVLSTGQRLQIERDIAAHGISLRESIDPIFDEEMHIAGLVLIVRDVTREREAERAIRYRNRQLAALNAIASATLHAEDLQSIWEGAFARIIDVTGADAGAILGLDPVATHGGAARAAALVERDPESRTTAAVLAAEVPLALEELPVPFSPESDDGTHFLSALYAPLRSRRRAVGLLVIAYVARRQFSANERQLLTVAGQQIGGAIENARLIANLQHALDRVREANRLKDEFLATVSHELRTPLTAIQGWAEVLGDPETSTEEAREGLSTIQQASESLTQLISDLLEMSRIETRMLRLERHPIDPNYPVQAAVQTVRQMAEVKGVTIETSLAEGLPMVDADSGRLQQVMWNLLVNAIKFTPAGGHVWVVTDAPVERLVRVRVHDDGAGIDPDFIPHVFERFRQADGSATRQYGGLGIGLSLVRSLVEAHEGSVVVESDGPGKGATFTVTLPATH
jgi:signal transduction histidine kinase